MKSVLLTFLFLTIFNISSSLSTTNCACGRVSLKVKDKKVMLNTTNCKSTDGTYQPSPANGSCSYFVRLPDCIMDEKYCHLYENKDAERTTCEIWFNRKTDQELQRDPDFVDIENSTFTGIYRHSNQFRKDFRKLMRIDDIQMDDPEANDETRTKFILAIRKWYTVYGSKLYRDLPKVVKSRRKREIESETEETTPTETKGKRRFRYTNVLYFAVPICGAFLLVQLLILLNRTASPKISDETEEVLNEGEEPQVLPQPEPNPIRENAGEDSDATPEFESIKLDFNLELGPLHASNVNLISPFSIHK